MPERLAAVYAPDLVQTLPAAGIQHVHVHLVSGDVTIEASDRADIRVLASGLRDTPALMPELRHEGGTLHIDGENEYTLATLNNTERVKLVIQLPKNLAVTLVMLAGTLQLNGPFEALDMRLRFGSVCGCAPARHVKLRVFAGDVRLGGLTGSADVQLSLGDLTMAWAHLDGGELISVRTFVGETALDLPDGITLVGGRAVSEAEPPGGATLVANRATETLESAQLLLDGPTPAF